MMELSAEVHDLLQRFRTLSKNQDESRQSEYLQKAASSSCDLQISRTQDDEFLNLDDINFDNDEYWLCGTPSANSGSIQNWLYENRYDSRFTDSYNNSIQSDSLSDLSDSSAAKKLIDSRTFTRPKKKIIRPSLDRYREDLLEEPVTSTKLTDKSEVNTPSKPLHFDLTQPMTCSRMFDNIAKNAADNDSFQNMSPPSLINSMCSSTFANVMETSIIRNDPIIREIRAADYSNCLPEPLMLQSLQSLTESYSSINSDSAELFLRRTVPHLLSGKTDLSESDDNFHSLNGSQVVLDDCFDDNTEDLNDRNLEDHYFDALTGDNKLDYESISNRYENDEYVKSNETFNNAKDMSNESNHEHTKKRDLDTTYNKSANIEPKSISNDSIPSPNRSILNGTFTRQRKSSPLTTFDANQTYDKGLSQSFDKGVNLVTGDNYSSGSDQVLNGTYRKDKDRSKTRVIDVSALRNLSYPKYGGGSGDSLDRLSNYSGSSKGSVGATSKMTMAEVDAIVEQQEQSLLMSTPKPAKSLSRLFDPRAAMPSPINLVLQFKKENLSDSELSEEYATARSSSKSKRLSMHSDTKSAVPGLSSTSNLNRSYKSMSNLKQASAKGNSLAVKPSLSTANYATFRKPTATVRATTTAYNSTSYTRSGSERNVPRTLGSATTGAAPTASVGFSTLYSASNSNLRTMGAPLKASYTSLRPTFANLPHAPAVMQQQQQQQMAAVGRSESATALAGGGYGRGSEVPTNRQGAPIKSASAQSIPSTNSNGTFIKRGLSALPRPISGIPKPTSSKIPGPKAFRPSTAKPLTNLYYSSNAMR